MKTKYKKEDCFGMRCKDGNYEGEICGLQYRSSGCCGTWNLYRNNKFVKHIGLDEMREMEKMERMKKRK
jgi:hypothetical protein